MNTSLAPSVTTGDGKGQAINYIKVNNYNKILHTALYEIVVNIRETVSGKVMTFD